MKGILLGIAGVAVVSLIFYSMDLPRIAGILQNSNIYFIFCAVAVQFLSYFFLVSKVRLIATQYKKTSYIISFKLWLTGALLDLVTPFIQIGGEPMKILFLKKNRWKASKASAVVVTDTFVELFAFFTMLIIVVILLIVTSNGVQIFSYVAGISVSAMLIFSLFYVSLNKKILLKVVGKFQKIGNRFGVKNKNYRNFVFSFEKSFRQLLGNGSLMSKIFLLSLGAKILDFFRIYFIFLAIGYPIGVQTIVFVWAIVLIFSMLPGLPGNLGIVEAGAIAAYVFFGVPVSIAAAVVLVDRIISFWMLLAIGGSIFGTNAPTQSSSSRR